MLKMAIFKDGHVKAIGSFQDDNHGVKWKYKKTHSDKQSAIAYYNSKVRESLGMDSPAIPARGKGK